MNIQTYIKSFALGSVLLFSVSSNATIIASTDFDDKIASVATASNLNWITNGISDPLSLTATEILNLNPAAGDMFAVDHNLISEGSWSVDIALNVSNINNIALSTVTLNAFIFNNNDVLQTVSRDVDFNLALYSGATSLDNIDVLNVYANSGSVVQGKEVSFDLTGNTLFAGNDYFLRLTASGNGYGNNAGFDNLVINGDIQAVSEPSLLGILGLGLMLVGARRFKS